MSHGHTQKIVKAIAIACITAANQSMAAELCNYQINKVETRYWFKDITGLSNINKDRTAELMMKNKSYSSCVLDPKEHQKAIASHYLYKPTQLLSAQGGEGTRSLLINSSLTSKELPSYALVDPYVGYWQPGYERDITYFMNSSLLGIDCTMPTSYEVYHENGGGRWTNLFNNPFVAVQVSTYISHPSGKYIKVQDGLRLAIPDLMEDADDLVYTRVLTSECANKSLTKATKNINIYETNSGDNKILGVTETKIYHLRLGSVIESRKRMTF